MLHYNEAVGKQHTRTTYDAMISNFMQNFAHMESTQTRTDTRALTHTHDAHTEKRKRHLNGIKCLQKCN